MKARGAGNTAIWRPPESVFPTLFPTSQAATAMPIQSKRNQRSGDLVRELFFITTEPPSLINDASPFPTSIPSLLSLAHAKITAVMYSRNVSPPLQTFLSREVPR
jgi:hypothetical protein